MTRDDFLTWTELQRERYEFDGFEPVAITGGNIGHSQICQNICAALRSRLRGSGCVPLGPDAGVATIGDAVRYPDALVTCTNGPGTDLLVPGVVVVFEVVSAGSGKIDRSDKVLEYAGVASIRRCVIVESSRAALSVHSRAAGEEAWMTRR